MNCSFMDVRDPFDVETRRFEFGAPKRDSASLRPCGKPVRASANLPFELQARIASSCRDSLLSRIMTLQYTCAFAKTIIESLVSPPNFEYSIVITTGSIIRTQSLDFGDRLYVTSISTSSKCEGASLELL